MRVEFGEHAVDGILHEFFLIDTVDVEIRDGQLCKLQFAKLFHINVGLAAFLGEGRCAGAEEREAHEDEMFFSRWVFIFFLGRKSVTSLPKAMSSRTTLEEMLR